MTVEGLIAPEGTYLPTYTYQLPTPPTFLTNSLAPGSSSTAAEGNGSSSHASDGPDGSTEGGAGGSGSTAGEVEPPKTALHYISMQAPSAWTTPLLPPSKMSVASIRYPPSSTVSGGLRRERQQSSQVSTSDVMDGSNASESSLSNADVAPTDTSNPLPTLGPVLESTLASQGIDGAASQVTGGQGGIPGMTALQLLSHLGGAHSTTNASQLTNCTSYPTKNLLKPRNNLKQTSSSFVQRLQSHNEINKIFSSRTDGATLERFAFVSRGRMLYWLGETGNGWIKDPLARLTFAAPITSHDINQLTRSPSRLDVIVAFSSSDVIWYEAMSSRYTRFNKGGCVNDAPITSIRWIPGSETLFLTCHSDGTCTLFDISREDSTHASWTPIRGYTLKYDDTLTDESQEVMTDAQTNDGESMPRPAIQAWNPLHRMLVTRPENSLDNTKRTWSKLNPIAHWRILKNASISDVAFAPDHTKLALVSTDGTLRVINLLTESLEGIFESYYGALNRVVFSPDAKFILTGGCDDLVSVWTSDGRLLSRCVGHTSFVTGMAFDPWRWSVEDKTYRFASVGEDGRILLWDFSSTALVRPKMPNSASSYQRRSANNGSTYSLLQEQQRRSWSGGRSEAMYVKSAPRNQVAELQPVASFSIGSIARSEQASTLATASTSNTTNTTNNTLPLGASTASPVPTAATANTTANTTTTTTIEPGSPNDLLTDVRFRPDGILLMHKSGTFRLLQRPRSIFSNRAIART